MAIEILQMDKETTCNDLDTQMSVMKCDHEKEHDLLKYQVVYLKKECDKRIRVTQKNCNIITRQIKLSSMKEKRDIVQGAKLDVNSIKIKLHTKLKSADEQITQARIVPRKLRIEACSYQIRLKYLMKREYCLT